MTTKKKGFTLIELMIVVAIIGILAAIAIPNFVKFQAKGKQAEVNAQLKAIFSAQKANFPTNQGYWSDIGAIGFAPERGNRYYYDLGPSSATIAAGTQGFCGQFQSRTAALITQTAGDCGVSADVARHGTQFNNTMLDGLTNALLVPAAFVQESSNAMLTMAGVNGAACPNCDFAAFGQSNVDNDAAADVWWISTQTLETAAMAGCPPAMTVANGNAYTSGSPAPINDDVCNEL